MLEFFFRSLLRGLSRKIGLRRAATGHVFSYNVLCRKIYPTLPEPRNICSLSFFNDFCPVGKVPNRRDHGSLSQNRPRIFRQQFMSFEKKHFYTRCAGLSVYALLTVYSIRVHCKRGGMRFLGLRQMNTCRKVPFIGKL